MSYGSYREERRESREKRTRQKDRAQKRAPGAPVYTGRVKFFDRGKGFGFVIPDDPDATDGRDVFVHHSAIIKEGYGNLFEGDLVEYNLVDYGKGPQARAVERIRDL